jgi:hypothetical protein
MAVEDSQYGYIPHEYVAIIFIVLFGISTSKDFVLRCDCSFY